MKKTLVALMALAGVAAADTYEYVGKNEGWAEVNTNWKSKENGTSPGTNGNKMNTGTGNTFVIDGVEKVKAGGNFIVANTTLIIKDGSELYVNGGPTFNNSTVTYEDGAISTCNTTDKENGVKIKDTIFNINSTLSFGRVTFNNDPSMGNMTFNLGEKGQVSFANTFVVAGTKTAKYNGQITLSAICTDGFLSGYGDISVYDRVLVDFGSKVNHPDCADFSTFLDSEYVTAGSFTLNGEILSAGKYSADALSAGDVGKYQFVVDGSKLKVQYVAYSVPEPTTATLSLLALAGLAARRRRR